MIRRYFTVLLMLLLSMGLTSQLSALKVFELSSGVIVDPDNRMAYVMNAGGGIDAVDLKGGTLVWSTDQAAKPLTLVGNRLFCLSDPLTPESELKVVILDVGKRGQRVIANSVKLPQNVQVSINETLETSFTINARISGGAVFMPWKYSYQSVKGIEPQTDKSLQGQALSMPKAKPQTIGGTVRMEISSGAISIPKEKDLPAAVAHISRQLTLAESQRLPGIPGPQFISADGRHVLKSECASDSRVWDKCRWEIYNRSTGKRVGEVRNHQSNAPFFVHGALVIYQTGPYVRRTQKGLVDEPLKIRAVDMNTGKELWSRTIRDTAYRGPFPG